MLLVLKDKNSIDTIGFQVDEVSLKDETIRIVFSETEFSLAGLRLLSVIGLTETRLTANKQILHLTKENFLKHLDSIEDI